MSNTHDTDDLIAVLDAADEQPAARALRARSYDLLALAPGAAVADIGCGAGRAVAELAGRGAHATGVDPDERMLAAARRRWPEAEVRHGDAYALPFGDGTLDGYRADKVYHLLDDPARAAREARRVLAPGGRIVLLGQDWDALVIDADDAPLTRRIVQARGDALPSPHAARGYRALLLDAGFREVTAEAHVLILTDSAAWPSRLAEQARATGAISPDEAAAWLGEQHERARAGRLFVAVPIFVAAAVNQP
jgi:SAM-dependent methyltransferase